MKTIVLIDYTTGGHHLAFMRLFTQALLDLNHRVIVLIPESEKIRSWVAPGKRENLIAQDFEDINPKVKIIERFDGAIGNLLKWKHAGKKIKEVEIKHDLKIDLVFFAWLDSYLANYLHPILVDLVFPFKWSGLYFHPRHLRLEPEKLGNKPGISDIDIILTSHKCQNITIHDEGIIESFTSRLQGKKVILFPEIADTTAPDENYLLAKQIRERAAGRIIIGIIGLEKRKGILTMINLAKIAPNEEYFFVFAGKMLLENYGYTPDEQILINEFVKSAPENCLFYPDFIEEGGKFNAVLCSFDIPFIVYNIFPSSSNILTKAAFFQKFVISSSRFCIGEDVKKYELGLTVEEGNVQQCLEAISILKERVTNNQYPKNQAIAYSELHSKNVLSKRFEEILSSL